MQQSSRGLLCSLAYQILEFDPAARFMIQSQSYARKESHTDWSISELKSLCLKLLGNSAASFCVFVDGLDELDPSEYFYDLWVLIQSMQAAAPGRLKLCLSSRPEPDIRCYLGRFPGLKVQCRISTDRTLKSLQQINSRQGFLHTSTGTINTRTGMI